MIPRVAALRLNVEGKCAVVDRVRLSDIIRTDVLELDVTTSLNLQEKGARAVDVHVLKLHTEDFTLDEGDGSIGRVDDVTVENVNVRVNLLIQTAEPHGTDTEAPVVVGVSSSKQCVSVHLQRG